MPSDICPSLFYVTPSKNTEPNSADDIFMPDRFKVLQKDQTHIDEIIANTGANGTLQIRLLSCYLLKDLPKNYCAYRRVDNPRKRTCTEKPNKNGFVHFHVKQKKVHDAEYLIAFIEGASIKQEMEALIQELFFSISWLEIAAKHIFFWVFTIGRPIFPTATIRHLDECISSKIKNKKNCQGIIDFKVSHVRKHGSNLTISFRKDILWFTPS